MDGGTVITRIAMFATVQPGSLHCSVLIANRYAYGLLPD
jgi:hypothetical protein